MKYRVDKSKVGSPGVVALLLQYWYSPETSLERVPKSDEHQYCSIDATTPRLPTLHMNPGFIQTWR